MSDISKFRAATHSPTPVTVLLADDDEGVLISGKMLFEDMGWNVFLAYSPEELIKQVNNREFDVALIDMNYTRNTTSGQEGLELIDQMKVLDPDLPIIVMTAWATIDIAVESLKRGARDFIQKPWDNERVIQQISKHARTTRSLRTGRLREEETKRARQDSLPKGFIAESDSMKEVIEILENVSPSEANILLTGENGTGKSLIARMVHEKSLRKNGPFISVNIGGLAENLFESEIFGHVKGAFTDAKSDRAGRFELARGGTIFLDEIGNISIKQQNRLLRLLEEGEFERVGSSRTIRADARVISATNSILQDKVIDGSFREDLMFRLNTVIIKLPPLRDRLEDIVPLSLHFLKQLSKKYQKSIRGISNDAQMLLKKHSWPGNIREMRHALERAVLMCHETEIHTKHLMLDSIRQETVDIDNMTLEEMEKLLMQKALKRNQGNVTEAAKQLGMSRATFYRRLEYFGI